MRNMFHKEQAGIIQHTTHVLFTLSANRKILLLAIMPSGCTSHTLQQDTSTYKSCVYPIRYHIKDSSHLIFK